MKDKLRKWLQEKNETDTIRRGGIGMMLILLLLFLTAVIWNPSHVIPFAIVYGAANIAVFWVAYLIISRRIRYTLYRISELIENLIAGKEKMIFPIAEDTILSKLQGQLLKLYDILRSYEEKEQKMRKQLDENIGNLVHQINTPITNIGLYVDFMKRDDLGQEESRQFLNCIEEQAQKLSWLGEGFSKISRIETGIIRLKPQSQEILPVILSAVNQVMMKAERKEMDIELKGERHLTAMMDEKWTTEAIFNVLDNAVKYGTEGTRIEIEITALTGYVCVSIRNNGIRIEKEEYYKVFKRFYRGTGARNEEGVGLGLYIAKEILEGERGYIKVETLQDGRVEFSLYFMMEVGIGG